MSPYISGPYYDDEIVAETVKIYRTGKIKHLQYNGLSERPVNEFDYKIGMAEMNTFFNQLVSIGMKIIAFQYVMAGRGNLKCVIQTIRLKKQ